MLARKLAKAAVASVLFLSASAGCRSMSGTCLCAAAWNTISGLWFRKYGSHGVFVRNIRDQGTMRSAKGPSENSLSISKSAISACSTITSALAHGP